MWSRTWDLARDHQRCHDRPEEMIRASYSFQRSDDWFHNNAVTYNRADDSIAIVSSRENFVICLDYETGAIKWILGDTARSCRTRFLLSPSTPSPVGAWQCAADWPARSLHHLRSGASSFSITALAVFSSRYAGWSEPHNSRCRESIKSTRRPRRLPKSGTIPRMDPKRLELLSVASVF